MNPNDAGSFFWNTFVPTEDDVPSFSNRFSQFSRTEQFALAGCLRLVMLVYPERVAHLNDDMKNAIVNLSMEVEALVRS